MTHLLHTPPKTQTGGRGRRTSGGRPKCGDSACHSANARRGWQNASQLINNTRTQNPASVLLATRITGSFTPHRNGHESGAFLQSIHTSAHSCHRHTVTRIIGSFTPHRTKDINESQAHSRLIAHIPTRNISSFLPHHTLALSCHRLTGTRITGSFTPRRTHTYNES
jgi:hypothetical protein